MSRKRFLKKRHIGRKILASLLAGVSQRETARMLRINRKTVVRYFRFFHSDAKLKLMEWNRHFEPAHEVEFDDLETFEHTKMKPLSVSLMVEYKTRRILGFEVSQMPAKGRLAQKSIKKYGPRPDHRSRGRKKLFSEMREFIQEGAIIRSDSNPHYPQDVAEYFPRSRHDTVLSRRGAVTGQGELKKQVWDPIFSLNHTCAMLRYHLSRLIRQTWNTTKKPDQLAGHLALYALEHNRRLMTG